MRRRRASVELFEEIRREYEFGVGTIQGVARKFEVHRRMVREALGSAVPPAKPVAKRAGPRLGPLAGFIDGLLAAGRTAPRKPRTTSHPTELRLGPDSPARIVGPPALRPSAR